MAGQHKNIIVLTGAGISAESGLKTFRDNNGLWENHRVEEVATPQAFASNPDIVYRFYNLRREQLLSDEVWPNKAHLALADFEKSFDGTFNIITQNVDNLHETAGSKNTWHMHGELSKMRCQKSDEVFEAPSSFDETLACECCQAKGSLRPHIVWFGEMPFYMDEIQKMLSDCDLFISIGTSGQVYPAASFVQFAAQAGAYTVELNLERTQVSSLFNEGHYGKASEIVPKFLSTL